jgi:hypothetical protein
MTQCNRSACQLTLVDGERWWNPSTRAWYCQTCARHINKASPNLCVHELDLPEDTRLKQWVCDLQSKLYVNCVYCGHRYGPRETTPVVMADVLKAHISVCPEHPLSKALKALDVAERALDDASGVVDPGEDEKVTYERELKTIRDTIAEIRGTR